MVRGTGKYKTKRGGGRNFSRDMVLDKDGIAESKSRRRTQKDEGDDDDDDDSDEDAVEEKDEDEEDEEEDEDEEEEEAGPSVNQPELSRPERRALKAQKKRAAEKQIDEEEDEDLINPNHVEKKLNISDLGSRELTRKEREAKEKQEAKERYWKLHLAGKTDEAKSDLARLKKIREEREAAQAKRKAEAEAKAAEVEAKKKAAMSGKRI